MIIMHRDVHKKGTFFNRCIFQSVSESEFRFGGHI